MILPLGPALAQKCYEAYGDYVGWVTLAGLPMAPWEALHQQTRAAWGVATETALRLTRARTNWEGC